MPNNHQELQRLRPHRQEGTITGKEFNAKNQEVLKNGQGKEKCGINWSGATRQVVKPEWHDNKRLILILCIIVWPVGLIGLWKSNSLSKGWKTGFTLMAFLALVIIPGRGGDNSNGIPFLQGGVASATDKGCRKSYRSDPSGEKSISVQQIFEDTTNWGGRNRHQIITGYIKKLNIPKDALGQGDKVTSLSIGYDDKILHIILDNPVNPVDYRIGDQISIQGSFILINSSFGNGRGIVYTGPVSVIAWDYARRKEAPSIITIDDYFRKNMRLGKTPITIVGQVSQKKTERNKVWIRLGSRMGTIEGELSKSKINAKVRGQYQSIQLGDRVAFKGSFNTELGNTAYFTIEELIPSPHY